MKQINLNELKYIFSESVKILKENDTSEDRYLRQVSKIDDNGNPLEYTVYYVEDPEYVEKDYGEGGDEDIPDDSGKVNIGTENLPSIIKVKNKFKIRGVEYVLYDDKNTLLSPETRKILQKTIKGNTTQEIKKSSELIAYTSFFNEMVSLSENFFNKNTTASERGKNKMFSYLGEYGPKEVMTFMKEITKTDWKIGLLSYKKISESPVMADNEISFPLNALMKKDNGEYELQYDVLRTNNKKYRTKLPVSGVRVFNMSSFSPALAATLKHRNSGKYIQSGPKLPTKMGKINGRYGGTVNFNHSNMVQRGLRSMYTEKPNYKVEQILDLYHGKNIPVDTILSVLDMDPTQEHNVPIVNRYVGAYGRWLMSQFYKGNLKLSDTKITDYLRKFHEYRKYMAEPVLTSNTTPEDLCSMVDNFKMKPEYENPYMDDIRNKRYASGERNIEYPYHMATNRPFGDDFDYSKIRDGIMIEDNACKSMAFVIMKVFDLKNNDDQVTFLSIKSSSDYNERAIGDENKRNSIIWYLRNEFGIKNRLDKEVSYFQKTPERLFVKASTANQPNGFDKNDIMKLNYSKLFSFCKKAIDENNETALRNLSYTNDEDDVEISDITEENGALIDLEYISNQELYDDEEKFERTFYSKNVGEIIEHFRYLCNPKTNLTVEDNKEINSYTVEIKTLNTTQKKNIQNLLTGKFTDKEGMDFFMKTYGNGKIVVVDDNYATGKTLDMACFELVYTYHIPPQNIIAITPGWMAAKK